MWKLWRYWRYWLHHFLHTSGHHQRYQRSDLQKVTGKEVCKQDLSSCLQQMILQFSALTHLAPFSSSSPAQREETASEQSPGCPEGQHPAVGEPQVTGFWRARQQSAVRPATFSSWLLQSHSWWQRWRRRPAGVSGRCCRSVGSGDAEHRERPQCTPPGCQRHSNLRGREEKGHS